MPSRCTGTAKSTRERCKRLAHPGAVVCVKHGAAAPQVKAAAARRVAAQTALQWAEAQLEAAGETQRTPLEHLEAVLEQDARAFALWDLAVRSMSDEGNALLNTNRHGEQQIHPYVEERNKAAARWARTSKYALDGGVSQKRVEIEQKRGELMAAAFRATFAILAREYELEPAVGARGIVVLSEQLRQLAPPA